MFDIIKTLTLITHQIFTAQQNAIIQLRRSLISRFSTQSIPGTLQYSGANKTFLKPHSDGALFTFPQRTNSRPRFQVTDSM